MEFSIRNVPFKADEWEVTKEIARQVLHVCPGPFVSGPQDRPPNFKVELNKSLAGGVQNNGSGTLFLTTPVGRKFQRLNDQIPVDVRGKKLRFIYTGRSVGGGLALTLEKARFINPDIERDRAQKLNTLCDSFYITHVQIGVFYLPQDAHPRAPRSFSVEWDQDLERRSMGLLFFEYDHKCLRVRIGDQAEEDTYSNIIIPFSSINKMAMGYDFGNPYICFDLFTPPQLQKEIIFHSGAKDGKYRYRVASLNPGHEVVAPYAHHLRIVLYDTSEEDVLKKFEYYCETSSLQLPKKGVTIEASGQGFFSRKKLNEIATWLRSSIFSSNWRVAFQVEALLHNGIANSVELMALRPRIEHLIRSSGDAAGDIMRRFVEVASSRPLGQRVSECFEVALKKQTKRARTSGARGRFYCHHVTFTPTRLHLEGPTITQSNRVIRAYEGYEDYFLRVSFRDEDRLQYKWNRDVDGVTLLQEHVGNLLKNGFDLAGRRFQFLAYSQSALKEHAVWYVSPFRHMEKGLVTAQTIRNALGNFTKVIESPSKYGARMAQAFTGTDPSVRIWGDQWSVIPDIEENGINFTDGVGTISTGLAERIWEALCADNPTLALHSVAPSAYQIRFLGCKGVVSVDPKLEGIHMCVRPSMNKFDVPGEEYAAIEIADIFGKPNVPYLNRPLVMLLEDREAPRDVFLKLQEEVVANARTAHDSADQFASLLESSQLCFNYRLAAILRRLKALGLELKPSDGLQQPLDTPFFARLRACAINHVLRAVKHEARIPIPNSYMLVGVADEGPAYVQKGETSIFCLPQGKIFACVQTPDDEGPRYLEGMCLVFRNPVIHPGDVQRVYAIGRPPENATCLFGKLKNVVVFSSTGTWSLPNGLGGGDLDGDRYTVVQYADLLVPVHCDPASYPSVDPFKLDRPSTIDDVCNFIVEYINSDVVGLVASKHITIADQSKLGSFDPDCLRLSQMHSSAVDYPKNGNKVDISDMPRALIKFKPDWKSDEDPNSSSNLYESSRALGYLYRNVTLNDIPNALTPHKGHADQHPISKVLYPHVRRHLAGFPGQIPSWIASLFAGYREELVYIAGTFTLSKVPGTRLREEELVIGTILANCTEKRYRSDRLYAMKENVRFLVLDVKEQLVGRLDDLSESALKEKLAATWGVWIFSLEKVTVSGDNFGLESFGLIGLGLVLECLERLGSLPPLKPFPSLRCELEAARASTSER